MNVLLSRKLLKKKSKSSNIKVYYNYPFPIDDIIDIFYSLFSYDYTYDNIESMINKAAHIFCAYDIFQRRCVGCALVNDASKKGGLYLALFGVQKTNQHHGVGTKLLEKVIQWARQTYHAFIYLHVNVDNYKAIGLYKKLGFRTQEYIPYYYFGSTKESPDAFRMILLL